MATVRLEITPEPGYVRTARLVGVAVARRAGVDEELLDEVRLAIGEACGRAVARHQRYGITALVRVEMSDDGPYTVRVIDSAPADAVPAATGPAGDAVPAATGAPGAGPAADEDAESDRMGWTLLAALVADLEVTPADDGVEVRMVWPARR